MIEVFTGWLSLIAKKKKLVRTFLIYIIDNKVKIKKVECKKRNKKNNIRRDKVQNMTIIANAKYKCDININIMLFYICFLFFFISFLSFF